jgi:hypothetical protein
MAKANNTVPGDDSRRRDFLKGMLLASTAGLLGCHTTERAEGAVDIMRLMRELLKDWGDALVRLQVNEPGNPKLHGSFRCPACTEIHGRGGDAVYPLLFLARQTGDRKYIEAAVRSVEWMKNVDAPDGAWTNDVDPKSWKGITV